jgi:hypothetical protein
MIRFLITCVKEHQVAYNDLHTNVSRISIFNSFIHNIDWQSIGTLMPTSFGLGVVTKTSELGLNIPLFVGKFDHEQGLMHHYLYMGIKGCCKP